jgi:hypothetical protein
MYKIYFQKLLRKTSAAWPHFSTMSPELSALSHEVKQTEKKKVP